MIYANKDSRQYQCPTAFNGGLGMPCLGEECAGWRQVDFQVSKTMDTTGSDKEVIGYCGMAGPVIWKRGIDRAKYAS